LNIEKWNAKLLSLSGDPASGNEVEN